MAEELIGMVSHYFSHLQVAAIDLTDGELKTGDTIHLKGHTTDFTQTVESLQLEHDTVEVVKQGQSVGIKVAQHAREHDNVYKVTE